MMDRPCICGHLESVHYRVNATWGTCRGCTTQTKRLMKHDFKLDNLKYLEELSK